jgi:hypothetical protein
MHTSEPRRLRDNETGTEYKWLLHFSDWLPRNQHYTFAVDYDDTRIMNISIAYFVDDLRHGMDEYLRELGTDPKLQENYMLVDPDIRLQVF